jgi:hypothetical protein
MCPSPNGRIIYIRKSNPQTFQVELIQYNLETEQVYMIDTGTFGPILAPNNKWIINCRNIPDTISTWGSNWLDVVYNPNGFGEQSNYESLVYSIPNLGLGALPNYANFRLGPIDGSICDTLGLNNPIGITEVKETSIKFNLYPNPFKEEINVSVSKSSTYNISITDMLGKKYLSKTFEGQKTQIINEIEGLNSGIYWLEILDIKTGMRSGGKIVK